MRVVLSVFLVFLLSAPAFAATNYGAFLKTQVECGEKAQELLNNGYDAQAEQLLAQGVKKYPNSDWLRSLFGRALFSTGKLDEAEDQFQRALAINKDNPVARMLIKEIRLTKDALKDREMNEIVSLGMDKAADLAVLILGVWLGTLMTMVSGRLAKGLRRSTFESALKRQDWDVVTDILENQIANWKKAELRKNMELMLAKYPQKDVERIIIDYVDVQHHEDALLYFLRKLHAKRG